MQIDRIEPLCWFSGMKDTSLQLMVYGNNLMDVKFETTLPIIDNSVSLTFGCNCVIVNFSLRSNVPSGEYSVTLTNAEGKSIQYPYHIVARRNRLHNPIDTSDVIYLLMPDRFARSTQQELLPDVDVKNPNGWHGGNIRGVIEHLDYIKDLGVTAIWLTPVFENDNPSQKKDGNVYETYHGYSITNFYDVDKHYGNLRDYCELVVEAHRRGLRVIKDVVFNHCSINHPWLKNLPQKDWINGIDYTHRQLTNYSVTTIFDKYASASDKVATVNGWFTDSMPDLNLRNPDVLKYLTQMTIWWIETADIDAIRMDTYLYSDFDAMQKWQRRMDLEYPGFSIIAETWVPDAPYTARIQQAIFNANKTKAPCIIMDFAFQKRLEKTFYNGDVRENKETEMYDHFVNDFLYDDPVNTLAFIDNHDLPRWLSVNKGVKKLKQALAILMTSPRIPQLYYGTEILMSGDEKGTGDGNYREDMFDKFSVENLSVRQKGMLAYVKKLLNWRKNSKAITQGTMVHYVPFNGCYTYFRRYQKECVIVISNLTNQKRVIDMQRFKSHIRECTTAIDIMTNKKYDLRKEIPLSGSKSIILSLECNE